MYYRYVSEHEQLLLSRAMTSVECCPRPLGNQVVQEDYYAALPPEKHIRVGDIIGVAGEECDDFNMPLSRYSVKALINDYNGIPIDSYVVKRLTEDRQEGLTFSLSKSDCKSICVDYEPGLELLAMGSNVVKLGGGIKQQKKFTSFTPSDMSTYFVDKDSGRIRYIIAMVRGILSQERAKRILNHIEVKNIFAGTSVSWKPIVIGGFKTREPLSIDGCLYLELELERGGYTPEELRGVSFDALVDIDVPPNNMMML